MSDDEVSVKILIPEWLSFSDLKLARDAHGRFRFEWFPIKTICEQSGIDVSNMRDGMEDNAIVLIVEWYLSHIGKGGARDPVADALIAEVLGRDK